MKTNDDKKKFLEEIEKTPLVLHVSKKVGIDKATIYRWKQKDKRFAKAMARALSIGRAGLCDVAEAQLAKSVHQGDFRAIKFWLENNDKRYIKPRVINMYLDKLHRSETLTQEQIKKLDNLLRKAS